MYLTFYGLQILQSQKSSESSDKIANLPKNISSDDIVNEFLSDICIVDKNYLIDDTYENVFTYAYELHDAYVAYYK